MINDQSFVDLRLNNSSGQGNESFWPSFTDIMTVIVMIFLLSMVVLLIRNMELVNELRSTMAAEREAMELARTTGEEKQNLASRLDNTSDQLQNTEQRLNSAEDRAVQLQLQIMRLREQNQLRTQVINQRNKDLQAITEERNNLANQASQLTLLRQKLEKQVNSAQTKLNVSTQNIAALQQRFNTMESHFQESESQLVSAKLNLEQNNQLLANTQVVQLKIEDKYLVLSDEFDDLKVRYDKLVRPARSSKGHYLVEVRYLKEDKGYNIGFRHGGSGSFASLSPAELESSMKKLLKAHPKGLYVKVILPENSGLSYNEAWTFTNNLHKKYDYYFQQSNEKNPPKP